MVAAFITCILFALSASFGRRSAAFLGGTAAHYWRLLLATALLGIYAHGWQQGIGGGAFWIFFVSGCIGFGAGDIAFFNAMERIGSRVAVLLMQCLAVLFAALAEWLWLDTLLTGTEALAVIVILGGVTMAMAPSGHIAAGRRQIAVGIFFGALGALGQGLGAVISRVAYQRIEDAGLPEVDGMTAAYQRLLGGVAISVIWYLWRFKSPAHGLSKARQGWKLIVANALCGAVLGVSCYQMALQSTPSAIVLPIVSLTPIVVIPLAWLMEGDRPTRRSIIGGVIAVGGAALLSVLRAG